MSMEVVCRAVSSTISWKLFLNKILITCRTGHPLPSRPTANYCRYGRQMVSAVQYLHGLGLVHGDLKLSNVLCIEPENKIMLCDFGMSDGEYYT